MARKEFLPYALPLIEEDDIAEVVDSLKSNWITKGPKTMEFEKRFAEYVGAKYAIAVNSCTAGLHLSLVAAGIKEGDFPQAEATFERIISLPLYPKMSVQDVDDVISAVRSVVERHRK